MYFNPARWCSKTASVAMLITWQGVEHPKLGCFGACLVGASNLQLKPQYLRVLTSFRPWVARSHSARDEHEERMGVRDFRLEAFCFQTQDQFRIPLMLKGPKERLARN